MREIDVKLIKEAVKELCIEANSILPCDLKERICDCKEREQNPLGKEILGDILNNLDCAKELRVPICQDTGMAVIFIKLGQEVSLVGGDFNEAVEEGVRQGYIEGNLRCSVVKNPLNRVNTGDNTPPVVHLSVVPGDRVEITVAPKGFGSENMSAVKMFTPSATEDDIVEFVKQTVKNAGANPCPPIVVGVGIGGDFEYSCYLSKKALCREVSISNEDEEYAKLEGRMLAEINSLDIGPQGFGGNTTALAVNIEWYPTHIAGLPVAVNIGCHVTRHKTRTI